MPAQRRQIPRAKDIVVLALGKDTSRHETRELRVGWGEKTVLQSYNHSRLHTVDVAANLQKHREAHDDVLEES